MLSNLSPEMQLEIVQQAGSTYRNVVITAISQDIDMCTATEQAISIADKFVDMMVKKLTDYKIGE